MKSYSILSPNDGQLLIRMHDELVKGGMKSDEWWNKDHNPNTKNELANDYGRLVYRYCLYTGHFAGMCYYNHDCESNEPDDPELIHLTPENFDEVLKKVLANLKNYSTYGKRPSNAVVLE
jgi:hypothetical protein